MYKLLYSHFVGSLNNDIWPFIAVTLICSILNLDWAQIQRYRLLGNQRFITLLCINRIIRKTNNCRQLRDNPLFLHSEASSVRNRSKVSVIFFTRKLFLNHAAAFSKTRFAWLSVTKAWLEIDFMRSEYPSKGSYIISKDYVNWYIQCIMWKGWFIATFFFKTGFKKV